MKILSVLLALVISVNCQSQIGKATIGRFDRIFFTVDNINSIAITDSGKIVIYGDTTKALIGIMKLYLMQERRADSLQRMLKNSVTIAARKRDN